MHPLTRSCFLLLLLGRLFLLALPLLLGICLRSPRNPPFPRHSLAPIPLFLAKVRLLPTLTLSPLMIWYSGQTALFLFLLAKAALTYLLTALSVTMRPVFPFQQAKYVPGFPLKPAPFCTLFAGLGSTNKPATYLLLSDSRFVLFSIFPHISNSVADFSGTVFSPPVPSGYNGSPDTRFFWGATGLMSWPDGECYLRPLQCLVVSLLLSLVSTFLGLEAY